MTTCFLISVYINDNYNDFVKAINSCFNQTISPTRIIIVMDGPVKRKILDYCTKISVKNNVLLVNCPENVGLGSALNKGFKFVNEDIVLRMDSDDISRANRVENTINFFKNNPDIAIYGSYITEFKETLGDFNRVRKVPLNTKEIMRKLKFSSPFNHVSVAFNFKLLPNDPYKINYNRIEDYATWYSLLVKYKLAAFNSSDILVDVKLGKDFINRRKGFKLFKSWYNFYNKLYQDNYITRVIFYRNIIIRYIQFNFLPERLLSILYFLSRSDK